MTYSVVGMGAIGGYYGGQLANAGREVHFLSHSDYEHVLHHGLQVDSCNGNFHLPHIKAYGASKDMPKTDIIIVGLKSVKNHDVLPELLRPIIHENSVVVLIQNGIGLEDDCRRSFPGYPSLPDWHSSVRQRSVPAISTTNVTVASIWATIPVLRISSRHCWTTSTVRWRYTIFIHVLLKRRKKSALRCRNWRCSKPN